jgi:succinate-acetate transporter protein
MRDSTAQAIIAVVLAGYGIYTASYVPAMLQGPSSPGLLILFVFQAVCALAAAVGVWRGQRWTAGAVVALGVAVAATSVFEGFILGIVPYLRVVLVVVAALVATMSIAAFVNRSPASTHAR